MNITHHTVYSNKRLALLLAAAACGVVSCTMPARHTEANPMSSIYEVGVDRIDGTATNLAACKGKVMLIVNVASKCGFTGQYAGLQKLYDTYKDRGLVVLGFPANDFLRQEPGTNEEIQQFCTTKFNVTFPMFSKIAVTGGDMHPLYRFLTGKETNPGFSGGIKWNFTKFLVGRDGTVIARFGSMTQPEHEKVTAAIEKALALLPSPPLVSP
jgi:glutathione peroxidase